MALYQNDPFVRGKMLLVIGRPPQPPVCLSINCLPMANHSGYIVRVSWQCRIKRVSRINKVVYESQPNKNWVLILDESDAWPTLTKQTLHQMRVIEFKGRFSPVGVFTSQHLCNDNGCSKTYERLDLFDGAHFFNKRITTYAYALTQSLHKMKMNFGCSHICLVTMGAVKFLSAWFFDGAHLFNPRIRTSASGHFHGE